jgi:hypothetical protein
MDYKRITIFDNRENKIYLNLYINEDQARIVVEKQINNKKVITFKRHVIKRYNGTKANIFKSLNDYTKLINNYKNNYNYVFGYDINLNYLKQII